MKFRFAVILGCIILLASCGEEKTTSASKKIWRPAYAKGFLIEINSQGDSTLLLRNPNDTTTNYTSVPLGGNKPGHLQLPLSHITSLSATHLAFLSALHKENTLVGFAGLQYVRVKTFIPILERGKITELGAEEQVNIEKLLSLKPDVFMCYPTASNSFSTIKQSGVPVLPLPDYLESHPLARAEYILLFGILTGEYTHAKKVFADVEKQYKDIKRKAWTAGNILHSMAGKPIDGIWHVPCGQSYVARFLTDAGSRYTFSHYNGTNVQATQVEEVIARAKETEYWFFIHNAPDGYNLQQLVKEHPAIQAMKCYKEKKIFMCNSDAIDVFGEGIMQPHIMLSDLAWHMHPEIFTSYEPVYFKLLR